MIALRYVAFALLCLTLGETSAQSASDMMPADAHWVAAWTAPADSAGPPLSAKTVRHIVRPSIGGSSIRIRLSNLFGTEAVTLGAVRVAKQANGSAIQPKTDRPVTFGGKATVTIARGGDALSDPILFPVAALENLAVSLYVPPTSSLASIHGTAVQTAYIASGDVTAAITLPAGEIETTRFFLTDIEVATGADVRTVAILGDSITDGIGSTEDANARWPDALAARLQTDPKLASVAVINAGISGNRLLNDAAKPFIGPSMSNRFDRDVLSKPGVRWVVLFGGINDINAAEMLTTSQDQVSAQQVIDGMQTLIARAHAKGIRVAGATLMPLGGVGAPFIHNATSESKRQAVNAWIRTGGEFDAVVDFDALMRDPARTDRLRHDFDSGDHLHPNDAGHRAMAAAIDLRWFGAAAPDPRVVLEASERALAPPANVRAVTLTMQGVLHARGQASRPEIPIAELPDRQSVLLARDGRYRLDSDTVFPGAIRFHYLTVGSPTGWASVDLIRWRDGNEIDRMEAATGDAEFSDLLLLAPGLLLADTLRRAPDLDVDDATGEVRVTFRDRIDRLTVIAIDPATKLVKTAASGDKRYVYEDYRKAGDALQPQRISIHTSTRLTNRWESVAIAATDIDAHTFDLPAGYVERADRSPLRATALGNGAYRIDGSPSGYHTGFVVGTNAVAVFDAPISPEEAEKVRAVIEKTAPGRRIAYVVVSHTHADHVAGLPTYLEAGATALTGKGGGIALRRQFENLSDSAIEEVSASRTLDLGGATVTLYPLASSHAADMLVSYARNSRTLFQGDLFYLPEVGATPATFEGGEELSRLIATRRLDVVDIVGVHGRSGGTADLADGVKLRRSAHR